MKLRTLRPLFFGMATLPEGRVFVTDEQHGRDLLRNGFVEEHDGDDEPELTLKDVSLVPPSGLTSASLTGTPLSSAPSSTTAATFKAKHKGAGKWIVVDAEGNQVGAFIGDQDGAKAEAERLAAGGEPLKATEE
ncbi:MULTISPECIES: hypothetical protein [unclassified Pseudomonas]|uniref:hypothetical protein n=1 Tax=unclassified Pseudomonas TaxID=196821 RepID=UPI00131B50BF|nr:MULTISPECIES: hypothetical protein [unclassified Pseudomonas]